MRSFEEKRNNKIFDIIIIIKVIYLLLSFIAIISSFSALSIDKLMHIEKPAIIMASISVMFLIIIFYLSWLHNNRNQYIHQDASLKDNIEFLFLFFISITVISVTGFESSQYKFINIFIILISAIQFGRKYTISIASISALIIFFIDIVANTKPNSANIYFEMDLVVVGAFLITGWILGMYVDIEKEHTKELRELVNIDELTGLFNHRYFQENLTDLIKYADENKTQVSLLFMDIDYFKNYNDTNGHQLGDKLLRKVGRILKSNTRKEDIVARYGGEEFAIILPNTSQKDAFSIGERIRTAIQDTNFEGEQNQPEKKVTISIGVSTYPLHADNKYQFINTADDALYRAKAFNKNRVELYYNVLDEITKDNILEKEVIESVKEFLSLINDKDRYTYGHTERVVIYSTWFAKYLNLSKEDTTKLKIGAYLHDIGKNDIPEEVLNKKSKLTDDEFIILKSHPLKGVELIKDSKYFNDFTCLIKHHHERYDGSGYPDKLQGNQIPYLARILTIVDSFDAMTSNRPYNIRKSHSQAIEELRRYSGTQFDPDLTDEFINMLEENKEVIYI